MDFINRISKQKFRLMIVLLISITLISCGGSGKLFGPTQTPTPTIVPTPTPTATPDPIEIGMEQANQAWRSGDFDDAIAAYVSLLDETTDPALRMQLFSKLTDAGFELKMKGDSERSQSGSHEDGIRYCQTYRQAQAAFKPILSAQDRPAFGENTLYTDAAQVEMELINCRLGYEEPAERASDVLRSTLAELDVFPAEPAILDIFAPVIAYHYRSMAEDLLFTRTDVTLQEVLDTAKVIKQKIGGQLVDGKKISDEVDAALAEVAVCSETPITIPDLNIGTSTTKKMESCPFFGGDYFIDDAGLRAADASEVWYVIDNDSTYAGEVQCTGYRTDTGTTFTYSYAGQSNDVYTIRDVHTNQVVATKTFYGTAPRCVFTSCSLNTFTNTANCTGGEGSSSYDPEALAEWLQSVIK